jgi:MoxR-like ATPase
MTGSTLLDDRLYIESIVAGIKVRAHRDFRLAATMNDDASTYELPEYIHSRLQPQILLDFPDEEEEKQILAKHLPFADDMILEYVTGFLQRAHAADERYTVRDGINIVRYALKRQRQEGLGGDLEEALRESVSAVLGDEALGYLVES